MMTDASTLVKSALFATLIAVAYRFLSLGSARSLPPPPGPKGWPMIGNALQIPPNWLWKKALEWGKTYGDLVYLENFGKPLLIINSYDVAVELLSNRSAKYASRPPCVMMGLEGWDWVTAFMPYGERHRKHRAFMHRFVNSPDTIDYLELQAQETRTMLQGILENPKNYGKYIQSLPGCCVLRNFYGHKVVDENDSHIQLGEAALTRIGEAENYLFLDSLPWLRYLPGWLPFIEFQRVAKEVRSISQAVLRGMAKQMMMGDNTASPSMMSMLVGENTSDDGSITDEEDIGAATATLYLGGVETTVTALLTFVLAMLRYPEVQERARSEVVDVVGEHRLPSFEDVDKLPYAQAVCTEVLRWRSIHPLLVAHFSTEDDNYKGYHVPAGTTVFANAWAMINNPDDFPDPTEFRPERWLNRQGDGLRPCSQDIVFGFGRRACPGQKWAEHLLFIAMASLIAAFKFEAKDKDGHAIPIEEKYEEGLICHLAPPECRVVVRSDKMASLIRNAEI